MMVQDMLARSVTGKFDQSTAPTFTKIADDATALEELPMTHLSSVPSSIRVDFTDICNEISAGSATGFAIQQGGQDDWEMIMNCFDNSAEESKKPLITVSYQITRDYKGELLTIVLDTHVSDLNSNLSQAEMLFVGEQVKEGKSINNYAIMQFPEIIAATYA